MAASNCELENYELHSSSALTSFPAIDEGENSNNRNGGFLSSLFNMMRPSTSTTSTHQNRLGSTLVNEFKSMEVASIDEAKNIGQVIVDEVLTENNRHWMPDKTCSKCSECNSKFAAFNRRHHCRICGRLFCGKCCNQKIRGCIIGYTGVLRLCSHCFKKLDDKLWTSNENQRLEDNTNSFGHCVETVDKNLSSLHAGTACSTIGYKAPDNIDENSFNEAEIDDVFSEEIHQATGLARMFSENFEKILDKLLLHERLEPSLWKLLLWRASKRIVDSLSSKILKMSNVVDILEFVHIKKVLSVCKLPDYKNFTRL